MPEKEGKKPDPALQNEVFVKEVRRLSKGVSWTEEQPAVKEKISSDDGAGTFYTFKLDAKISVVEWRSKSGFNIAKEKTEYGKGGKLIMNPYLAAKEVSELLKPDEVVGLAQ